MAKTTPLNPVDAAWFHMDRPANPVMVTGVTLLRTPIDFARVRAVIGERLLRFDRFRHRVIETGFPLPAPHWEPDPRFDLDAHLHHIALPHPGDKQALLDLLADLASTRFDPDRPLWQAHIVDGVGRGSAMVLRFHHCIGDGTAMMALAGQLFDTEPDPPPAPTVTSDKPYPAGLLDTLFQPAAMAINESTRALSALVDSGVETMRHPEHLLNQIQAAVAGIGTAALSVIKPADPIGPLKGPLSGKQRIAFSAPVSLATVKAIGALTGTKVNDVLVAGMAGALRHYLLTHGGPARDVRLRAVVPVDLRSPERALDLGNNFGLTFLDLPVGEARPIERLRATKRGMDAIKRSPEAVVFLNILGLFGQTPKPVEDMASSIFGSKATVVMTNVAGPQQTLYLAGCPAEQIVFWVPHPVSLGVGISILSYNGMVTLGVITDAGVVPDPQAITDQFNREFAALRDVAMATTAAPPPAASPMATTATPPPAARPQICAATTRAGQPCRNRTQPNSRFCRVHSPTPTPA